MDNKLKIKLIKQLVWDYDIPVDDIEAVLEGKLANAGHYTRSMLFQKVIETYPWFTVIQLFSPIEIKSLLTADMIKQLKAPSLQKKYEFILRKLQEVVLPAG